MKCNLFLMNFLGIPSVCWRESRSPCRALWEVDGVSLSPHWPSFSDFSESFVQDWSPRTMSLSVLCHDSVSVKKTEGHLLRDKQEMEEGSSLHRGVDVASVKRAHT